MSADESGFPDMTNAHATPQQGGPRETVRAYVRSQMAAATPPISRADLAKRAGVDRDTLADFLNGKTWPQPSRLDAIEQALGVEQGTFGRLLRGELPRSEIGRTDDLTGPVDHLSEMVVRFVPGALSELSPTQRDEVEAAAKAAALQRIREIRGQ